MRSFAVCEADFFSYLAKPTAVWAKACTQWKTLGLTRTIANLHFVNSATVKYFPIVALRLRSISEVSVRILWGFDQNR